MRVKYKIIDGKRICTSCKENKSINEFYIKKRNIETNPNARYSSRCIECERRISRASITHRRRTIPNYQRRSDIKFKFKITLEEYQKLKELQKGSCYICKKINFNDMNLDHNHKTGKIRKFLCTNCNTAIGMLDTDNTLDNLFSAINYIREHS